MGNTSFLYGVTLNNRNFSITTGAERMMFSERSATNQSYNEGAIYGDKFLRGAKFDKLGFFTRLSVNTDVFNYKKYILNLGAELQGVFYKKNDLIKNHGHLMLNLNNKISILGGMIDLKAGAWIMPVNISSSGITRTLVPKKWVANNATTWNSSEIYGITGGITFNLNKIFKH